MTIRTWAIVGLAIGLAGCGGAKSGSAAAGGGGVGGGASAWNVTDACATFGKDRAQSAYGKPVSEAKLDAVHQASEGGAAMSMCTYKASDGTYFSVMLRATESGDNNNAKGIADIRSGAGIMEPAQDLHDLPGTLLWQQKMGSLSWFPDDSHMAVVAVANGFGAATLSDDQRKAKAIAIAKALP